MPLEDFIMELELPQGVHVVGLASGAEIKVGIVNFGSLKVWRE